MYAHLSHIFGAARCGRTYTYVRRSGVSCTYAPNLGRASRPEQAKKGVWSSTGAEGGKPSGFQGLQGWVDKPTRLLLGPPT